MDKDLIIGLIVGGIILIIAIKIIIAIGKILFKAGQRIFKVADKTRDAVLDIRYKSESKRGIRRQHLDRGKIIYREDQDGYWGDADRRVHFNVAQLNNIDDIEDRNTAVKPFDFKIGFKHFPCIAANNVYLRDVDKECTKNCKVPVAYIKELIITPVAVFVMGCRTFYKDCRVPYNHVHITENKNYWKDGKKEFFSPVIKNEHYVNFFKDLCKEKVPALERYVENHKGEYPKYKINDKHRLETWSKISELPVYNIVCFADKVKVKTIHKKGYSIIKAGNAKQELKAIIKEEYKNNGQKKKIDSLDQTVLCEFFRDCIDYMNKSAEETAEEFERKSEEI